MVTLLNTCVAWFHPGNKCYSSNHGSSIANKILKLGFVLLRAIPLCPVTLSLWSLSPPSMHTYTATHSLSVVDTASRLPNSLISCMRTTREARLDEREQMASQPKAVKPLAVIFLIVEAFGLSWWSVYVPSWARKRVDRVPAALQRKSMAFGRLLGATEMVRSSWHLQNDLSHAVVDSNISGGLNIGTEPSIDYCSTRFWDIYRMREYVGKEYVAYTAQGAVWVIINSRIIGTRTTHS
jgi:hypothetical protein